MLMVIGSNFVQVHCKDKREHVYKLEQFENAQTHDDLWNVAQVDDCIVYSHTACGVQNSYSVGQNLIEKIKLPNLMLGKNKSVPTKVVLSSSILASDGQEG